LLCRQKGGTKKKLGWMSCPRGEERKCQEVGGKGKEVPAGTENALRQFLETGAAFLVGRRGNCVHDPRILSTLDQNYGGWGERRDSSGATRGFSQRKKDLKRRGRGTKCHQSAGGRENLGSVCRLGNRFAAGDNYKLRGSVLGELRVLAAAAH